MLINFGLEIAMNGFYIPIVNEEGKILYTPEMYDDIRSKMQGLSYYGMEDFQLDDTARNIGTSTIKEIIEASKRDIEIKRKKIIEEISKGIQDCDLETKTERDSDLREGSVELIDTGSTGRGTNDPGDGDFDFMLRLDRKIMDSSKELKDRLRQRLSESGEIKQKEETDKGDFRYKGVPIDGLDEAVDIDLTFTGKSDEIEYTTDECIKDRLATIKKKSPEDYEYVIANILLAKKMLKEKCAYKKQNAAPPENGKKDTRGGLGAVGIENWILQNGGSFYLASKRFLETAQKCGSFGDFKKNYAIWDFGENHTSVGKDIYPHDNFVYNMNEEGYEKMQSALMEYMQSVDKEKENESINRSAPNIEEIPNSIESGNNNKKSISQIVQEDPDMLMDTSYMQYVTAIMDKAKKFNREYSMEK